MALGLNLRRELDTFVSQCVVDLREDGENIGVLVESEAPLLNQIGDSHLNLFWHFFVVHHCDKLLHEGWSTDLLVEWRPALVHDHV